MPTPRFLPAVTPLENRENPTGNITATVFDGTLFVFGDAGGNSVVISSTGWKSVTVTPGDTDDTVNGGAGGAGVFLDGISKGIVVIMGDANDVVVLNGVQNKHYVGVFAGGGDDVVDLVGMDVRGTTEIVTGDGADSVFVSDSGFRKSLAANLGAGDDKLQVTGSNARGKVTFTGGDGTDSYGADAGQFSRSAGYGLFENVYNGAIPSPPVVVSPPTTPAAVLASSEGESTAASPIPFTVSFGTAVSGFTLDDLGITNGTASDLSTADNNVYTFNVTPTADGAVTVSVPAGVATGSDGTANTAATPLTVRSIRSTDGMVSTDKVPDVNDSNWKAAASGDGLATWDIQTGSGTAVSSTTTNVKVFYTGWLTDGTVFDSSLTAGSPASFSLSGLIAGFQEGLQGMQPGGIRRFRIPPELGYGSTANGKIPADSTLIFEVKLVQVS